MTNQNLSLRLRNKILGALLKNARLSTGKQEEECALAIGVDREAYLAMEDGLSAPSLPQIENLAYTLDIPLDYFLDNRPLEEDAQIRTIQDTERLIQVRQRTIGALLKQARLEQNLSMEDLVEKTHIDADTMYSYEQGYKPVPLPVLEIISKATGRPLSEFTDHFGPVGRWKIQKNAVKGMVNLPPELQEFISQPGNLPFLELARKLSLQDMDHMRSCAKFLLEITS